MMAPMTLVIWVLRECIICLGLGGKFADEGPGDFGGSAFVGVDEEAVVEFLVKFHGLEDGFCWAGSFDLAAGGAPWV